MKKIFENFYLFSKLSISISLLAIIIGFIYIFYINYQKEYLTSNHRVNVDNELRKSIKNNADEIKNVSNEIISTKEYLKEINETIKSISPNNNSEEFLKLYESINLLNKNFKYLSNEIENIKNINNNPITSDLSNNEINISKNLDDLINLILIKYENGLTVDRELDYLNQTLKGKKTAIFEKIFLLSSNNYKGHTYLEKVFEDEVDVFLKYNIDQESSLFFKKIFLPYIKISPATENKINDDVILDIIKIKKNIHNKNIEKANKNLKKIKNYQKFFNLSSAEINKFLNFKDQLLRLK